MKQRGKTNKMKKTEDSSCSLPSHFLSTSRSPFSTCYIPFQSSGSQESTLQTMYDLDLKWGRSEDNCSKHVRISHNSPSMCEFRTTTQAYAKFAQHLPLVRNSHQPMRLWCEISSVLPTPHEIFSYVFFM